MITKKRSDMKCRCSKAGHALYDRNIISSCKKSEWRDFISHGIAVNILLNNILVQRGFVTNEQKWEDRKIVRTAKDEISVGTEHWRSEEMKDNWLISGIKQRQDLFDIVLTLDAMEEGFFDVIDTSAKEMRNVFSENDENKGKQTTTETCEKKDGNGCDGSTEQKRRWVNPRRIRKRWQKKRKEEKRKRVNWKK